VLLNNMLCLISKFCSTSSKLYQEKNSIILCWPILCTPAAYCSQCTPADGMQRTHSAAHSVVL
jgi:hypothetical protein